MKRGEENIDKFGCKVLFETKKDFLDFFENRKVLFNLDEPLSYPCIIIYNMLGYTFIYSKDFNS